MQYRDAQNLDGSIPIVIVVGTKAAGDPFRRIHAVIPILSHHGSTRVLQPEAGVFGHTCQCFAQLKNIQTV